MKNKNNCYNDRCGNKYGQAFHITLLTNFYPKNNGFIQFKRLVSILIYIGLKSNRQWLYFKLKFVMQKNCVCRERTLKKTALFFALGLLLVYTGCSSVNVRFDYERGVDFSKFKTFDFIDTPRDIETNELELKRIANAITKEMNSKGYTQSADNPDLLIAVHTYVKDKINVTNWGYSYADYYWYGYWGPGPYGRATVQQYEEGTLVIDIVDNAEDELIWRGAASRALPGRPTPEKLDQIIDEVITKTLANYPPPGR